MSKRGKFEKLERNDAYFETHEHEKETFSEKEKPVKPTAKKRKNGIFNLDSNNVPEKMNPSSRFRYTKERRKIIYDKSEPALVEAPSKAPLILMLTVIALVLVANLFMSGQAFTSMSYEKASTAKIFIMLGVYVVPSAVYIFSSHKRMKLYNMRKFPVSMLSLTALGLGLVTCLTLLQKYFITYMFSYSVSAGASSQNILLAVVTGALVPAICEELFVRGILQHEISEYAGGITGIVSGGLVFAILHFDLQYFTVYLAAGLVLGALTHITHSVFPAMIVHFVNNTVSILLSDKLSYIALWRISGTLFMIILAVLCFVFLIFMLRQVELISRKRASAYIVKEKEKVSDGDEDKTLESEEEGETKTESDKKSPTTEASWFFFSQKGKTLVRFGRIMLSPFMLAAILVFIVVVVIKLNF